MTACPPPSRSDPACRAIGSAPLCTVHTEACYAATSMCKSRRRFNVSRSHRMQQGTCSAHGADHAAACALALPVLRTQEKALQHAIRSALPSCSHSRCADTSSFKLSCMHAISDVALQPFTGQHIGSAPGSSDDGRRRSAFRAMLCNIANARQGVLQTADDAQSCEVASAFKLQRAARHALSHLAGARFWAYRARELMTSRTL